MLEFQAKMGPLPKFLKFYCLAETYGKGLFCMNIWHRAEVYPVLCSVHSVMLQQFAIF